MMLLQIADPVEILTKYDQVPIVVGMIICVTLLTFAGGVGLWVYSKYGRQKLEITPSQVASLTNVVLKEAVDIDIQGVKLSKMLANARHDLTAIKNNKDDNASISFEMLETLKGISEGMETHNKNCVEREIARIKDDSERSDKHHKERIELMEKHHITSIELLKERSLSKTA